MPGEFDLIRRYFKDQAPIRDDVVLGIGDDGAQVKTDGSSLAITVDALVSGVHFPESTPARAVGHRSLAVNLSDVAAMGAVPQWVTLALTLPTADENWLADFCAGFFELARAHNVQLIGGDTVRGPLHVAVQAIGRLGSRTLRRDGGQVDDDVWVSGNIGDAAAGLRLFEQASSSHPLVRRFLYPTPRVNLGVSLVDWATACIDVSDGLAVDLRRLASASGCGAELALEALPLSQALSESFDMQERQYLALNGGDDYELCFCVPRARRAAFVNWCRDQNHVATRVGRLRAGDSLVLKDNDEIVTRTLSGYDHFTQEE
ncbi:MAG: thiamine-phosphate kinase [Gammaproteobacteria bacterium]